MKPMGEACAKADWQVHACCLMLNHFHLVLESSQGNLEAGMKCSRALTLRGSTGRHQLFGHLFSGRYKAVIVDNSGDGYLHAVCDYVHLNPVRAKLLEAEEPLRGYRWSSYGEYLQGPNQRPQWQQTRLAMRP